MTTVGCVTTFIAGQFYAPLLSGIIATARPADVHVLALVGTPREIGELQLAFDRVDGWIVVASADELGPLQASGKPIVLISATAPGLPSVMPDNVGGMRAAVRHLIEGGHTRIAFLGFMGAPDIHQRYESYLAELDEHGIEPDPALTRDTGDYSFEAGHRAMQALLADGPPFTAIAVATDLAALGAIRAINEAGRSIPAEIAIVSFDDQIEAQLSDPPLSSVSQRPDELGRLAASILLERLAGKLDHPEVTLVPTCLVVRASSSAEPELYAQIAGRERANWLDQLAYELVEIIRRPLPYDRAIPPQTIWPDIGTLIAAVAALASEDLPGDVHAVWESAGSLNITIEASDALVRHLRTRFEQHSDLGKSAVRQRISAFLDDAHLALSRAQMRHMLAQNNNYIEMLQDDHRIIWALNGAGATTDLDWVQSSHMHWGVVGLIEEPSPGQLTHDMALRIVGSSVELPPAAGLEKPLRGRVIPARAFPPLDTIFRLTATHPGEIIKLVPIDSPKRRWGYFACAETHVVSGYESILMRLAVLAGSLEREELVASLQERQQTLSTAYDRERALADTVRELGCPIIPLIKGVLLVPLVGAIDSARSREIIERVLSGVNEQRAVHVLLDITGVPLVDTLVAAALVQTARAAELLGAQVALVGVRPEIAQSIIGLGVDLKAIETYPTLASAVAKLLRRG